MAFPATYATIAAAVAAKSRCNATDDASAISDWINQAYAALVLETEFLAASGTLTLTAGTASYDLTTVATGGVGRIKALTITSSGIVGPSLQEVTLSEILALRESAGGAATAQSLSTKYTLLGYKTLELYPTPAAADTLTVYYVGLPTAISGSQVPILGEPYGSKAIEYQALVDAAEFKADPKLAYWQQQADAWRRKLLIHLNRRRGGQPGQFSFVPGTPSQPHDPATILPA